MSTNASRRPLPYGVLYEAEERKELRAEERILEQREARKHQTEVEDTDRKAKVERDLREVELRRKIKDRKDHEAGEEKRKIQEINMNPAPSKYPKVLRIGRYWDIQ